MKISIDKKTAKYLLKVLKDDDWWKAVKVKEAIKYQMELEKQRSECEHTWGAYTGKRVCCIKCGVFDVEMGMSWTLDNNFLLKETVTKPAGHCTEGNGKPKNADNGAGLKPDRGDQSLVLFECGVKAKRA